MQPILDRAMANGAGVFIVTRSSNPEGRSIQGARHGGATTVEHQLIIDMAAENHRVAPGRIGPVGAVFGPTHGPPAEFDLTDMFGLFLAPGVGAQGATPADVAACFASCPVASCRRRRDLCWPSGPILRTCDRRPSAWRPSCGVFSGSKVRAVRRGGRRWMGQVNTVRGPVDAGALGHTLMHEHVFVRSPEVVANWPTGGIRPPGWPRPLSASRSCTKPGSAPSST